MNAQVAALELWQKLHNGYGPEDSVELDEVNQIQSALEKAYALGMEDKAMSVLLELQKNDHQQSYDDYCEYVGLLAQNEALRRQVERLRRVVLEKQR